MRLCRDCKKTSDIAISDTVKLAKDLQLPSDSDMETPSLAVTTGSSLVEDRSKPTRKPRTKKSTLPWIEICTVPEQDLEATLIQHFHRNGTHLSTRQTNKPDSAGTTTSYKRCSNQGRYSCNFKVRVQKLDDDEHSCVVSTQGEHSHPLSDGEIVSPSKQPKHGVPPEMGNMIAAAVGDKKRPMRIYRDVKSVFKNSTVTPEQLARKVRSIRKKESSVLEGVSMGEVFEWCRSNELNEDSADDEVGVLPGWKVERDGDKDVVSITISSKILLSTLLHQANSSLESYFSSDGTYKLLVNGYPVIVLGTVDGSHRYKPVSVTITSGEKDEYYVYVFNSIKSSCLLFLRFNFEPKYATPDSAGAIHNAMEEVFPGIKIAKRWAHLTRAFPKYKAPKFFRAAI